LALAKKASLNNHRLKTETTMDIITHACFPVVIVSSIEIIRHQYYKTRPINGMQLFFVGLAGGLPDILWPHFSLYQRMHSWTHTLWFLILLLPLVFIVAKWKIKEGYQKFTIMFWLAAMSHILLDGLSGGVNLFYPINKRIGAYYISYHTWIFFDIIFVCLTIFLLVQRKEIVKTLKNKNG
jgi:hypothetical protein